MGRTITLSSERIRVSDSFDAVNNLFYRRGLTDGLPIVPPTEERVRQMLALMDRDPAERIGVVPPKRGVVTVEKIAINAVMAGCLSEYLPVVIAAVEAMIEEPFNLYGIQATTNPVSPLAIVNGPIVRHLDINDSYNVFGQGWRANATIGRAIRLILQNVGGAVPGVLDRATQGLPAKYTWCIAENEEQSPWKPLHVDRGLEPTDSAVTMVGGGGLLNIMDMAGKSGEGILTMVANSITAVGTNNVILGGEPLVVLCPEHAQVMASDGFSKDDVRHFLFEKAVVPARLLSKDNVELVRKERGGQYANLDVDSVIKLADRPEDFMIIVAGGAGPHSMFIPTFGNTRAVTKAVRIRPGVEGSH